MSRITLDAELRARLNGLNEQMEICDETGKRVGVYLPAESYRDFLLALSKAHTSDEELERLSKEKGEGVPLAEIWKRLGRT
ncbi:MAG TPA: hypothetical protein VFA26_16775 [Gemmataceae bacterium]|nr:hypothetical protein [Gemmataceae bacterium]